MKYLILSVYVAVALMSSCELISGTNSEYDPDQTSNFDVTTRGVITDGTLFPLRIGLSWKYEMVSANVAYLERYYPSEFTVSVDDTVVIGGQTYFQMRNFLLPGMTVDRDTLCSSDPSENQEPTLLRYEDEVVYLLTGNSEKVLYSFREDTPSWKFDAYLCEISTTVYAGLVRESSNAVVVDLLPSIESTSRQVFNRGLGRVRISSSGQLGGAVWDLVELRNY